ncbi:M1 family metallopeptidase [Luteimonas sp. MC1782]|uniref:M1 family metallopeptidase n=1 Tax=Luteimonas sp. MC1782 TaxID=2760305 RepID=UPI0016034EBE|nr:M1 family metallopeptidase [Luteimonas sp. MC1782]MBB1473544.1 M1 family metallopeptidase [Luteimonas sp. MC1782]
MTLSRTLRLAALAALALAAVVACKREPTPPPAAATPPPAAAATSGDYDEHSYAEPDKVAIDDLALALAIDFGSRTLAGTATYTLDWRDPEAKELVLDTRDLAIERVEGEAEGGAWQPLQHTLAARDALLGSKLTIAAPERNARIRVSYRTSPEASGLQWLDAAMTQGKATPFMFSQSQAIHARSWVPLQDTPRVRYTYSAEVTAPAEVMVLMSADNDPAAARDGSYSFRMPQKIPSYLMAIAAGDLVFKPISARSGVWAEPAAVDGAVAEFADTEKMIATTEALYGPYRWERYDLLLLPPSFPFGGMENPRLSFITPTVVVGDKSLVSLIAHELAHSWSGNLVTNSSAKDGWLNEGFTSYVENRIVEALYGKELSDMEYVIARNALATEIKDMPPELQALAVRPGVMKDPDEGLSGVSYDKGAWFLQFLEERFGRAEFDVFLRGYFDHFAFQSISTATFVDYARTHLLEKYPGKVTMAEFDTWLYEPGIPAGAPKVLSRRFGVVDTARLGWLGSAQLPPPVITDAWVTQEWVHFLEGMPETLTTVQLSQLDTSYAFTGTPNGEIAMRWYPLAVRSGYVQANPAIAAFLQKIGRRKLIMPTYEALVATEGGLALAKDVFARARPGYHPITTASVEKVIAEAKPVASSGMAPAAPAIDATVVAPEPERPAMPVADGDPTRPAPAKR